MSGVPAVYYHGTGSENASRAYTETPMQHVQRTALRKKCMRSTFTLDCGKKKRERQKRTRLFPLFFSLSLSLSLSRPLVFAILFHVFSFSLLHVSPFNFNSFSFSLFLDLLLISFHFTFSQNIDHYRYSLSAAMKRKRFVDGFTICSKGETPPFRSVTFSTRDGMERFCSASLIAIHTFPPRSVSPRARNNIATISAREHSCSNWIDDARRKILRESFR